MNFRRLVCPIAVWYCSAIFRQLSTASDPPVTNTISLSVPPHNWRMICVMSSSASEVKL